MHLIITDPWLAKRQAVHLSGTRLVLSALLASLVLMLVAAAMYHWVFLKGARERWPVVGALVRLVVQDEFEQRDKFMRENLDVLARQLEITGDASKTPLLFPARGGKSEKPDLRRAFLWNTVGVHRVYRITCAANFRFFNQCF